MGQDQNGGAFGDGPVWRDKLLGALSGIRKATESGFKKSEQLSRATKHRVKRSLLQRDRSKLLQELGDRTFRLIENRLLSHPDLERLVRHVREINHAIQEETLALESLQGDENLQGLE